ncbi:arf-GAP with coiled-coil, ANK repeat and PH domain-containing protein 2-like isoform X2 [Babylonia areolata]|uniref:arf-GAP with coiled-coil, ANK repeat and PH domain-containing protein 2-like isoform X2 n=1 Tax=Babylonia areolata TaxID=304850 RepID=UPI003FCFC99E
MRQAVDFKECLKDSPKFRQSLEEAENDIESLEGRLEKLVKLCTVMIDSGKQFSSASSGFVTGVRDLASYFNDDSFVADGSKVASSLSRFAHAMTEMIKYFGILMDQAHRSVIKNLSSFIKKDIRKMKEMRKQFEKISDDLDGALIRNSNALRTKPQECKEAFNDLTTMKRCFAHTSLDYVFEVNVLHSKKRFEVLDTMLSFMHAQSTFFHQGHDLFTDLDPHVKDIRIQVEELSEKAREERKEMEERHTLVQKLDASPPSEVSSGKEGPLMMEGYLFKRTSNAFRQWVRRWFTIQNSQLVYRKRSKDSLTIMEEDLRLCTIRPSMDDSRRFCFEVVSPARSHTLQADSEEECQAWTSMLVACINKAYRDTLHGQDSHDEDRGESSSSSTPSTVSEASGGTPKTEAKNKSKLRMEQLLAVPGNSQCCDCGTPDPRWSSINLGITLCIECSGIHRSFGVHKSKVRSITLDTWEPELVKVMLELGNDVVNKFYEANVDETIATRATPTSTRAQREAWISAKYLKQAFVNKLPQVQLRSSSSTNRIRSWSVRKKPRRSPARTLDKSSSKEELSPQKDDVTSGLMEAVLSVSNTALKDNDSGLGGSSSDVLVFGTEVPPALTDINKTMPNFLLDTESKPAELELESSDDSAGEEEGEGGQATTTTSWEDMSKLDPNLLLYKAAEARNLPVMSEALANGADPNWVNPDDDLKTPIMKAVETGSLSACEFLLLNNAKLDRTDKNGRTPLHHATLLGHTGQVCQFLKRKADHTIKDNFGQDPLTIAVEAANADIVTLLRLSRLNEEMSEGDGYNPGDDTFTDVFRDFSNMASNHPEKLKRK